MKSIDKAQLVARFVEELRREADAIDAAARTTREGATHEEAKPENDKDTRAVEASYLAGAQAERASELRDAVAALEAFRPRNFGDSDPIALGAVVTVVHAGVRSTLLVAPHGGGLSATFADERIAITTPRSPLGRALIGKTNGDLVEVHVAGKLREYEIAAVR